jgi:hypothetical protein
MMNRNVADHLVIVPIVMARRVPVGAKLRTITSRPGSPVLAGLVPAIHDLRRFKWMIGTKPITTETQQPLPVRA